MIPVVRQQYCVAVARIKCDKYNNSSVKNTKF